MMILVAITALIAVCGAAKLDRGYLPPASAKTAGGSPESLQTPFAGNSFNNGLGGLPKGSYQNSFEGVVVDAAAAGTRASGSDETGLGGPRISYGSTDSKVGDAAFRVGQAGFRRPTDGSQAGFQGQIGQSSSFQQGPQSFSERPRAALDRAASTLRFENEVGPEGFRYAFETDNGIIAEESGVATNGVQAQGGFAYTGDDGQVYSVTYTADEGGYQPKGDHLPTPPPIPEEILKSLEQNAREEAAGLIDDGSYDAQKYNAGSDYAESDSTNGEYNHQSSKGNRKEADATASGTFISQNNQPFGGPNRRPGQSSTGITGTFGQGSNSAGFSGDASSQKQEGQGASVDFMGKPIQGTPNRFGSGYTGQFSYESSGQGSFNKQTGVSNIVTGHSGQSGSHMAQTKPNNSLEPVSGGISSQGSRFENINEYLPPVNSFSQNRRPESSKLQGSVSPDSSYFGQQYNPNIQTTENFQPLSQQNVQSQNRPQGTLSSITSYGKPGFQRLPGQSSVNVPTQSSNNLVQNGQSSQIFENRFGSKNEYLPPIGDFNQNGKLTQNLPDRPNFGNFQSSSTQGSLSPNAADSSSVTRPNFGTRPSQQGNTFAKPSYQSENSRFPLQGNEKNGVQSPTQTTSFSTSFSSQQSTLQPETELTTPIESNTQQQNSVDGDLNQSTASNINLSGSNLSNRFGNASPVPSRSSSSSSLPFDSQTPTRPQGSNSRPFGNKQNQTPEFPTQSFQGQYNHHSQFGGIQPQSSQNSFNQNSGDVQFSSNTPRPSYTQQPQGPDDSYYYNQPSKPFGSDQSSRFPDAPFNQFDSVTQRPTYPTQSSGQFPFSPQNVPSDQLPIQQYQGSSKYPRPPTVAPDTPTSSSQSRYNIQSEQFQGSRKYPRPPTVAPVAPTSASPAQYQSSFSSQSSGITKASISPFPSELPTQSTQFSQQGQFGSRPSLQQSTNKFQGTSQTFGQQSSPSASFGQQTTAVPQSFPQRFGNGKKHSSFLGQSQSFGQQQSQEQNQPNVSENANAQFNQQYSGEIYEYNKPAKVLPVPDHEESTSSGQFGQKLQSQFGTQSSRPVDAQGSFDGHTTSSQIGFEQSAQSSQDTRPQFGVQPTRPTFAHNTQGQRNSYGEQTTKYQEQSPQESRPEFGAEPLHPFGSLQTTQTDRFEQSSEDQGIKTTQSTRPQFGANKLGSLQSACCQFGLKPTQGLQTDTSVPSQGFGLQTQNRFGGQNAEFNGIQNTKPEQASSLAGKGEVFGGPRKPPSFNPETGYQY